MAIISTTDLLTQSPYIYFQGAGSDGTDGSAEGVHLRWTLQRALGDKHLPKGNLANTGSPYHTTAGFSKSNDYVKIYRSEYVTKFPATINFDTSPDQVTESAVLCEWRYLDIVPIAAEPDQTCSVKVRFLNTEKYLQVRATINPATDPLQFIQDYDDLMEAEVVDFLIFSAEISSQIVDIEQNSITRVESVSVADNIAGAEPFISCRKKMNNQDYGYLLQEDEGYLLQEDTGRIITSDETENIDRNKLVAENIKYIRFRAENGYVTQIRLETYYHYIIGVNSLSSEWTEVGQFGLTLDNAEAYSRLQNPNAQIHGLWPKYNGSSKVNVDNYINKWGHEDGLKEGVITYLDLSKSGENLTAIKVLDNIPDPGDTSEDQSQFELITLDFLKMAALDFHVARMLGLGHIDTEEMNQDIDTRYIYIASYETGVQIETGAPAGHLLHTYMTIPTGKKDYMLPNTPVLEPLSYGLYIDNGSEEPTLLSNEEGYVAFEKRRYINLHAEPFDSLLSFGPFFVPDEEYCYQRSAPPVFYGFEYKKDTDTGWRTPEISNDPDYLDTNSNYETVPIGATDNPIYIHEETEEGVHQYSLYAINWFSRVSGLSNVQETDYTEFTIVSTLMPPMNLHAQVIQPEDVLIFTTEPEQGKLESIVQSDKTLVRVLFDWTHVHSLSHWYGNKAEFFFRRETPLTIKGEIKSVTEVDVNSFEIHTRSYVSYTSQPASVVSPAIPPAKYDNFKGSLLSASDNFYIVEEVQASALPGEGPVFKCRKIKEKTTFEPDNDGFHISPALTILPRSGAKFQVAENMLRVSNWDTQLAKTIDILKFSDHTETAYYSDGRTEQVHIGGIIGNASIVEKLDVEGDSEGNPVNIPDSKTGIFEIEFASNLLPGHPDPDVEWYKGIVRVSPVGAEPKVLDVLNIDNSGTTLKLVVYDPTFEVDENYDPTDNYTPIQTGPSVFVNFHPGYRLYLYAESGFNNTSIYPIQGEGTRKTYMTARSVDTNGGIYSYLTSPVILMAREIIEPKKPGTPLGGLYATRPDVYGKSTYTLDTEIDNPYSLIFYRANETGILDAIYKPETITSILASLADIEDDTAFTSRWNELANVETDSNDLFVEWNGYRFPNPDNDLYIIPDPNPRNTKVYPFKGSTYVGGVVPPPGSSVIVPGTGRAFVDVLKEAVESAFLPLTEQPLIYSYMKNGVQPVNKKPVIRDFNGNILPPTNPLFDQAPMAVKPTSTTVRFTDFTLDGSSMNVYFYYVQEMNDMMSLGERSDIVGPVKMVDTFAPPAPQIVSIVSQPYDLELREAASVRIEINAYQDTQRIKYLRVYRALSPADASSIRSMTLVDTFTPLDDLVDTFADLDYKPYGDTLFYRIVALKEIENELEQPELIPSLPSNLVLANIIDIMNPEAPLPSFTGVSDVLPEPNEITDVVIQWAKTSYNGTYYLYQMSSSGNWTLIHQIRSNETIMSKEIGTLEKKDEDGNVVYYRFKVMVENASGLLNLQDQELII